MAHSNDQATTGQFVEVTSGLLLVFAVGVVGGPLLASGFMGVMGASGLFAFTALAHAMLAGTALWRMRQRGAPADEQRVPFTVSLSAAQSVSQEINQTLADTIEQTAESGPPRPKAAAGGG